MAKRQFFRRAHSTPAKQPKPRQEATSNPRSAAAWTLPAQCPICHGPSDDYVFDHCHASGISREWICRLCNTGLGMFRDNPEALERAAAYVRKHHEAIAGGNGVAWMLAKYREAHPRATRP